MKRISCQDDVAVQASAIPSCCKSRPATSIFVREASTVRVTCKQWMSSCEPVMMHFRFNYEILPWHAAFCLGRVKYLFLPIISGDLCPEESRKPSGMSVLNCMLEY